MSVEQPLFAFANVIYDLESTSLSSPHDRPTEAFALSSRLHTVTSQELQKAGVKATDRPSLLIDDFSHGFQDWYLLSPDNPHHWEFSTRKINDPKWRGPAGSRLTLEVKCDKPNELVVIFTEDFFRSYRGKQQEFAAVVKLRGGDDWHTVSLSAEDFRLVDGEMAMPSWQGSDILSLRAYHDKGAKQLGSKSWQGSQPKFRNLRWSSE